MHKVQNPAPFKPSRIVSPGNSTPLPHGEVEVERVKVAPLMKSKYTHPSSLDLDIPAFLRRRTTSS